MLPSLDKLALVRTGGFVNNAVPDATSKERGLIRWPESEVCSICAFSLARPTENESYAWPFVNDGTGFTAVACVRGHAFHKGCLRALLRFDSNATCPDCRTPMIAEVLEEVRRPDPEQIERERRAAEQREVSRREREREEREESSESESEDLFEQIHAQLESMGYARYAPGPQYPHDILVVWSFCVKGHIQNHIQNQIRREMGTHFNNYLRRGYPNNPYHSWSPWLAITMDLQQISPSDQGLLGEPMRYTKILCKLYLHYASDVREFVSWFSWGIRVLGYTTAMHEWLGITTAVQVNADPITEVGSIGVEGTELQASRIQNDPLVMTAAEYQAWPEWAFPGPTGGLPFTSGNFRPDPARVGTEENDESPSEPEDSDSDSESPAPAPAGIHTVAELARQVALHRVDARGGGRGV